MIGKNFVIAGFFAVNGQIILSIFFNKTEHMHCIKIKVFFRIQLVSDITATTEQADIHSAVLIIKLHVNISVQLGMRLSIVCQIKTKISPVAVKIKAHLELVVQQTDRFSINRITVAAFFADHCETAFLAAGDGHLRGVIPVGRFLRISKVDVREIDTGIRQRFHDHPLAVHRSKNRGDIHAIGFKHRVVQRNIPFPVTLHKMQCVRNGKVKRYIIRIKIDAASSPGGAV